MPHLFSRDRHVRAAGVALLLALSGLTPVAAAQAQPQSSRADQRAMAVSRTTAAPAALDSAVIQQLGSGGMTRFLVRLQRQPDPVAVATRVGGALQAAGVTPLQRKEQVRLQVVRHLQDVAEQSQAGVRQALAELQKRGHVQDFRSFYVANIIAVTGDLTAARELARQAGVAAIVPNREISLTPPLHGAPQDAPPPSQWNLEQIGAPEAWALGADGTGVVVANIDTGVDGNHPALLHKWRGYHADGSPDPLFNWFDAVAGRPQPYDDNGHGTHTMGTAVGSEPDGSNQIGVAPGARWIAVKAFTAGGSGTDESLLAAGEWILAPTDADGNPHPEMAPDVVNNSWGGGSEMDDWYRDMVRSWRAAGIFPVFANGNSGPGAGTAGTPGSYPESFAVGAVDNQGRVAGFSSRGPSPYGEIKPDVAAPGVNIRSSVPGGQYEEGWNGTSMATPHVAGAAALLLSVNASLTVDDLEEILIATANRATDNQYPESPNNAYGYGVINAHQAVASIILGRGVLTGRVYTGGDDLDAPAITHVMPTMGYAGMDVELAAGVTDDVSVTGVTAYARRTGSRYYTAIPMDRVSGDYKDGLYRAAIPGSLVQLPALEYYVEAVDYGNNTTTHPANRKVPHRVPVSLGVVPGYHQDFEGDLSGWSHGGESDPWQIGAPTSGPGTVPSGRNVAATNLSGPYLPNTNAYLLMPPIDLSGGPAAVTFKQWYDLEYGFDRGEVYASTDGSTWTPLQMYTGSIADWQNVAVNLNPFAGQRTWLLFNLWTDGSVQQAGWYLDDVQVLGADQTPPGTVTGLTAELPGATDVLLQWTAAAEPDVDQYRVYRTATSGEGYELIGQSPEPGYVDPTAPLGQRAYYRVTAVDLWGNEGAPSDEVYVDMPALQPVFADDMESGPGGWTHSGAGDSWALGTPTSGPGAAYSGANLWATNLAGFYANDANARLVSPPVDLQGALSARLRFWEWRDLENSFDFGHVEVSVNDGAGWTTVNTVTGASPGGFRDVDLTPFIGQTVRLGFRLQTDGSVTRPGWYLDDVLVEAGMPAAANQPALKPAADKRTMAPLAQPAQAAAGAPSLRPTGPQIQPQIRPQAGPQPAAGGPGITALPVSEATVTVLESGMSTRVDPSTARYSLTHYSGTFRVRAEAYSYYPTEAEVTLADGQTTTKHFQMQPIPRGTVTGTVTDAHTGQPVAGARVELLEDARVAPVHTGPDGTYRLTPLAGTYTLRMSAADYLPAYVPVTVAGGAEMTANGTLRPFIGLPDELGYDDGIPENAWAYFAAGNGWAVRFSPGGPVKLMAALYRLWDNSWPASDATAFTASVYAADGPGGAPGALLAGPVTVDGNRDGTWTEVALPGLVLDQDFYVAYTQVGDFPDTVGLAVDESQPLDGRGWGLVGGSWQPLDPSEGDRMIRVRVGTLVGAPAITSPADGTITREPGQMISGTARTGSQVTLYQNGTPAGQAVAQGNAWSISTTLTEGDNAFHATATVPDGTTDPSPTVHVTLDTIAPELEILAPAGSSLTNRETITVTGRAQDAHLATVHVDGMATLFQADGNFSRRVMLNEGTNLVPVRATDQAGNATEITLEIQADWTVPDLTRPLPDQDLSVRPGEPVLVAVDSEPGATVRYGLMLGPNTPTTAGVPDGTMTEVSPGHYEGTWTAPAGSTFSGAQFIITAEDAAGNRNQITAPGRISVIGNQAPTAEFTYRRLSSRRIQFNGRGSTDPDGHIVEWRWDFGDGTSGSGAQVVHRYARPGNYTVTLVVRDNGGAESEFTAFLTDVR